MQSPRLTRLLNDIENDALNNSPLVQISVDETSLLLNNIETANNVPLLPISVDEIEKNTLDEYLQYVSI